MQAFHMQYYTLTITKRKKCIYSNLPKTYFVFVETSSRRRGWRPIHMELWWAKKKNVLDVNAVGPRIMMNTCG